MPTYDAKRALELLRIGSGRPDATFRDGQEEAIRHVVEGRGRLLVVQKTGWGKSFVYFIATKLLREAGGGPALLVSPLLSLMRNQIAAAERMGVRAATINSSNHEDWKKVSAAVIRGTVDILLISPERLGNEEFRTTVLAPIAATIECGLSQRQAAINPEWTKVVNFSDLLVDRSLSSWALAEGWGGCDRNTSRTVRST